MSSLGPQVTVLDALNLRLETDPDGLYLDFAGDAYSAREIDESSNRLARALVDFGVEPGDRVATLLENSVSQVLAFFSTLKLGAIHVPINTAYKGEFLHHQLADSGAKTIITQADFSSRIHEVFTTGLPNLVANVVVGLTGDEKSSELPTYDFDELINRYDSAFLESSKEIGPEDLACFIYTAGTTGPSKGCMLPHHYIVALADQITRAWGRQSNDVILTPLPLFHFNAISVCVVGTLLVGGQSSIAKRFSVSQFWPEVKRTGATMVSLLGSLAILIAEADDHPDQTGHKLRLCAAAPMPPATDHAWRDRFDCATFSAGYGLTEASLISLLPAGEENKVGAAGKPNTNDFLVRIVDDEGSPVAPDTVGEIVCQPVRSNIMSKGYWGRPEESVAVMKDGWFHTGDLGRIDDDDFLFFVDRKKDYLRRRGENISSFEMERIFHGHSDLVDLAVHSLPSEMGEDEVKVTAVLAEGATLTEEELCLWSVDRVPYFAVPRYIEFRADLPRNPVGRVLKYELRDDGVTPSTWDREKSEVKFERR